MNRCARCSGELSAFAVFCPHCAQAHEPDFDRLIDRIVGGRYRIYRRLGRGGLSTIFAATDLETDRIVAIKVSDPAQLVRRESSYSVDANDARSYWSEMLERMRREAGALLAVDHPNIVRLHGSGSIEDDLRFVAMEFLRGSTLRDEMDRRGRIETSAAMRVALEISSALEEVHSRGIIHRDINPRNIFIAENARGADIGEEAVSLGPYSRIKLIDFGIAKFPQPPGAPPFTRHSPLSGTVAYASPEQCSSGEVDHRTDIYSLGVVLYEMVAGQRPFNGRTPTEIALRQIQSPPQPPREINPEIPARLERVILRSLAKNPQDRQQNIHEMSDELRAISNQIVIPLTSPARPATAEAADPYIIGSHPAIVDPEVALDQEIEMKPSRRRHVVAAVAAVILLAAIGSALMMGRQRSAPQLSSGSPPEKAAQTQNPSATGADGSDYDSLEMASRTSSPDGGQITKRSRQTGLAPAVTMVPPGSPGSTGSKSPAVGKPFSPSAENRSASATVPAPAPSKAAPQMPPATLPSIAIPRTTIPAGDPDAAQAPRRQNGDLASQTQSEPAGSGSYPTETGEDSSPSTPARSTDRGSDNRSSAPAEPDDEEQDRSPNIGPKLIQWSGQVNREREITIEMPGIPGTVEIPRVYRDRVGVVEPPSSNNRWRCAVLRVFGRGNVSIVIRWWPMTNHSGRLVTRQ